MIAQLRASSSARPVLAIVGIVLAIVAAGCGEQAPTGDPVTLSVTTGFGQNAVGAYKETAVTAGLTAMRQLQRQAKVTTTYSGKFVDSIDGLKTGTSNGAWLFYVDGIESDIGAASVRLIPGQVVQWDFHDWQTVQTGKAIVGAYPRPLTINGTTLSCRPSTGLQCDNVGDRLKADGVRVARGTGTVLFKVGIWKDLKGSPGMPDLSKPAATNGAFAQFTDAGSKLVLSDGLGKNAKTLGEGAGLVAAIRDGSKTTWVVTGTDVDGVNRATESLQSVGLKNQFAVAVDGTGQVSLPLIAANGTAK